MPTTHAPAAASQSPQRIRWGAVFAGGVFGIALLVTLTATWLALGYGSEIDQVRANLEWYVGASAIGCLFLAGLLAGRLSGVRGAASGLWNGVTIWGLALLLIVAAGAPAILNVTGIDPITVNLLDPAADAVLWATVLSIAGGLVAAGIGGAIGGALARPANADLVEKAVESRTEGWGRPARPDIQGHTVVVPDAAGAEEAREAVHARRASTS